MVYKKIYYSFHGAFIIPWNTHDATFMVINGEIQYFHELIMGISWEICLVVPVHSHVTTRRSDMRVHGDGW